MYTFLIIRFQWFIKVTEAAPSDNFFFYLLFFRLFLIQLLFIAHIYIYILTMHSVGERMETLFFNRKRGREN